VRVAIAHDWITQYAGSERCVEQMLQAFPGAELMTTVLEPSAVPPELRRARTSFLQHVPHAARYHEWLLPLMPLAWRLRSPVRDVDALVSSSHACAKAVSGAPGVPHLCYCHTPMRYAWDFDSEAERFPAAIRPAARAGMSWFRHWDRATADRVDVFVANSTAVAGRIARFYRRTAQVIHPPVRTDYFTPGGERGDEFLYVGRLVAYKRADLTVEAFAGLPYRLLVVGTGQLGVRLRATAPANVVFLGNVGQERLRDLYRSARALVYPAEEDFGIAMAEAQACGTPVVALRRGGAVDIVDHGATGWLVEEPTAESFRGAIRAAAETELDTAEIRRRATRFEEPRYREEIKVAVEEMIAQPRWGARPR
jgi:glycosyltransferase involved in cell wall biosynthesis